MNWDKKTYTIDDIPANADDIIEKAKGYGYVGDRGMFFTSAASQVLRAHGHKVGYNTKYEK